MRNRIDVPILFGTRPTHLLAEVHVVKLRHRLLETAALAPEELALVLATKCGLGEQHALLALHAVLPAMPLSPLSKLLQVRGAAHKAHVKVVGPLALQQVADEAADVKGQNALRLQRFEQLILGDGRPLLQVLDRLITNNLTEDPLEDGRPEGARLGKNAPRGILEAGRLAGPLPLVQLLRQHLLELNQRLTLLLLSAKAVQDGLNVVGGGLAELSARLIRREQVIVERFLLLFL